MQSRGKKAHTVQQVPGKGVTRTRGVLRHGRSPGRCAYATLCACHYTTHWLQFRCSRWYALPRYSDPMRCTSCNVGQKRAGTATCQQAMHG